LAEQEVTAPTTRITAVAALLVGLAGVPAFAEEEEQAFVLLPDKSLGLLASLDSLDAKPPPAVTDSVKWGRDWIGLGRDTALIFGYQVVTITMFYFLPESVSKWSDQQKKDIFKRWVDNVQSPHWDHDAFAINYIGHPYFGSAYYVRARERGFGEFDSFVCPGTRIRAKRSSSKARGNTRWRASRR